MMITPNNIPQGYKATPLGIIPQEWEVYDFDRIIIRPKSRHLPNPQIHLRCIELEHLSQGDGSILGYIDSAEQKSMKNEFEEGDVLFGKLRPYLRKYWLAKFRGVCSTEIWVLRAISDVCTKEYLFDIVSSYNFVQKANVSSGSKMPRAEWDYVSKIPILTPPLAEQKKIAEVLGVWDKAIEKQSHLIEQLTLRKRGLMQQLLTAKRRLPGFSDPWKEVKLGEICNITTGKLDANAMEDNGIYPFFTCAKDVYKINKYAFDTEALLISGNGEYVGYVHYCKGKFNAYQRTYVLDQFRDNIFYLKYTLQYYLPKRILQTKSSSNTPYIVIGTLQDMIILEPSKAEQTAIAEVLTAADREIELAQQKLELLRQQKRGLMQQLLTGKKRVKNYGDSFKIY